VRHDGAEEDPDVKSPARLILAAAVLASASAAAQEIDMGVRAEAQLERQHQLRFDMGFASALGFGGLAYAYSPTEHLELEAGVGGGFSGLQLSFMPKLTVGTTHRFVFGAGLSVGIGSGFFEQRVAPFVNVDVGYEYRARSGFVFYAAVGPTIPLGLSYRFEGSNPAFPFPQARFGFGYAF